MPNSSIYIFVFDLYKKDAFFVYCGFPCVVVCRWDKETPRKSKKKRNETDEATSEDEEDRHREGQSGMDRARPALEVGLRSLGIRSSGSSRGKIARVVGRKRIKMGIIEVSKDVE